MTQPASVLSTRYASAFEFHRSSCGAGTNTFPYFMRKTTEAQ